MEDVADCGIPGTEADSSSTRSVASVEDLVSDEVTVEECLWDCEWQPNPFYKQVLKWETKLKEDNSTKDNAHLLLFTSPQIPRNLSCLEDCFIRFEAGSDWAKRSKVRRKCSANGLDRLIPTHTKEGQEFIESRYSDASLYWENKDDFASVNPNLDCLEWKGKKFREKSAETSNFIDLDTFEDLGEKVNEDGRLSWVRSILTKVRRKKVHHKKDNRKDKRRKRNPKRKSDKRLRKARRHRRQSESDGIEVSEESYWQGTRQFSTNVEAVHRDVDEEESDDAWQHFMFRASNPVAKAVEICSLAKFVQIVKYHPNIPASEKITPFFSSGPEVCDTFLPDLFKPTCRCVGKCRNVGNKIRHFFTEEGLWGCQNACKKEEECEFYTLSRPNSDYILEEGAPDVHRCILWRHCDAFEIEEGSTTRSTSVSDHWSGPAVCGTWDQTCPILVGSSYSEVSTFSFAANITSPPHQTISPWKKRSSSTKAFGSSTFSVNQTNK